MFGLEANQQAIILALVGAALFGLSVNFLNRALKLVNGATCVVFNLLPVTGFFAAASLYSLPSLNISWWGVLCFVGLGIVHPAISLRTSFEGIRLLGVIVATTIAATAPVFAASGAVIFLDEKLTLVLCLGILGVVAGSILLSSQKGVLQPLRNAKWWFYGLPLAAALIRGMVHVFNKYGFQFASPMMGGLISSLISLIISLVVWNNMRQKSAPKLSAEGIKLALLTGITNALGLLAVYSAINLGTVVVVSPIVFSYPLFGVLANALFFHDEVITRNRLTGMLIVMGSIILISVFSEAQ